jgi:hypothetical protein
MTGIWFHLVQNAVTTDAREFPHTGMLHDRI